MAQATMTSAAKPAFVRLDWECDHFGFEAAQLNGEVANDADLAAMLRLARGQGIQLLVWPAPEARDASRAILDEFGGLLADRKATFSRLIAPDLDGSELPSTIRHPVVPYAASTASPALCELAISAGAYSRFHVDPHFSDEKFESMYRLWIERSVKGELADVVLVVPDVVSRPLKNGTGSEPNRPKPVTSRIREVPVPVFQQAPINRPGTDPLAGMITLEESGGVARIGLVAVAAAFRGKGIGSALMHAAHRWMHERAAREAQVVTQLANLPACRLYERSGYRLLRVQHYYHFWPLTSSGSE